MRRILTDEDEYA